MARIKEKTWADYDAGPVNELTKAELVKAVRRAAKAANQRLLRLERAGLTGGVYKTAQANLGGRRRFKEKPDKMKLSQLRAEYTSIREFLSAKTSTVQGQRETDWKRYATAVNHGFVGTYDEFYEQIERYFTDAAERLYSSDVLYQAITENRTEALDEAAEAARGVEESRQKGAALLAYMKRRNARKRRN
ncbi:hypothetical protein [Hominenteromicrobium sp.]|uniref:hypothetical protein n=1 Tax=Hominenteromicrobium sp. TaxID=3073581 RepID=UPI003A9064CE